MCLLTSHIHAAIKPNIHASFQAGVQGEQLNQEYLGVALFPTVASCFNHSCDPNTFVIDIGRIQATVASRRIFEGEEVLLNLFIILIFLIKTILIRSARVMGATLVTVDGIGARNCFVTGFVLSPSLSQKSVFFL